MGNEKIKIGITECIVSVIINILLFVLKMIAGTASGSIAMIADAWHTLSDSVTSIIAMTGFYIAAKTPDDVHPFGHGRSENIAAIMISTLLGAAGFFFIKESAVKIFSGEKAVYGSYALWVFIASMVIKEALARYSLWAARKTGFESLRADGWHHRSDAAVSLVIVLSILLFRKLQWVDGVLGILVSVIIFSTAWNILKTTARSLLGEKIGPDLEEKLISIIKDEAPYVTHIHHFHIHRYGSHAELTLHICLPADTMLSLVHDTASIIEGRINKELGIESTIHVEPQKSAACKE